MKENELTEAELKILREVRKASLAGYTPSPSDIAHRCSCTLAECFAWLRSLRAHGLIIWSSDGYATTLRPA